MRPSSPKRFRHSLSLSETSLTYHSAGDSYHSHGADLPMANHASSSSLRSQRASVSSNRSHARKRTLEVPRSDWSLSGSTSSQFSIDPLRWTLQKRIPVVVAVLALFWLGCMALMVSFHIGSSSDSRFPLRQVLRSSPGPSIPLPLPKQKVSVILMNHSRPRMIRESTLMRTLLTHDSIDEVLLLHSNPKTAFEFIHPKVQNFDATEQNTEIGLSLRFYYCQMAKNDWVIHVDDDMEFTSSTLNELLIEFGRNPKRIVGRFGRDLNLGNSFNGYNSVNTHKSTEVILTKLMVMERTTCSAFFEHAHLLWDDVILQSGEGPLWNGEDIFMSLVANHLYGQGQHNNYAMDWLNVWEASDTLKDYEGGQQDISGGMAGFPRIWDWRWWQAVMRRNRHYAYRGQLWQMARQRLIQTRERFGVNTTS